MRNSLSKGILLVLIANIINLVAGVVSNLILPKYLSVDSYAAIKEYQLYLSYVGIIHLGYNDAMYLRYGGKRVENLDGEEAGRGISTLRIYMLGVALVCACVAFLLGNIILTFISVISISTVLLSYYQFLYQACGEFKKYGRLLNIISVGSLVINSVLIFVFKSDNFLLFLSFYVLLNVITYIIVEYSFSKTIRVRIPLFCFSAKRFISGIKEGILLTLGNFSSTLMTTLDRWFVKVLLTTTHFAQYSFAVSMEYFLSVLVSPVTVTLYNFFCNHKEKDDVTKVRKCVVLFASGIITSAYVARFILDVFLTKYIESEKLITFLFGAQLFYVVVKGVYVNLHKANGELKKYFRNLMIVIVFGFVANVIAYMLCKGNLGFAIATFCSAVFWFILCLLEFKDMSKRELVYIILAISAYLTTSILLLPVPGFIVYVALLFLLSFSLMRDTLQYILSTIMSSVTRRRKAKE